MNDRMDVDGAYPGALSSKVRIEVVAPRKVVIAGGGIVGASTALALVSHPKWRPEDSVTLVEATEIAAAASGKAGGFLALDWHSKQTQSLAALSFKMHCDLADSFNGEANWGFRRIETYSVSFDETRKKSGKTVSAIPWLDCDIITKSQRLGGTDQTAQCDPKLLTQFLIQMAQAKGLKVAIAAVDGFIYQNDRATIAGVSARTAQGQALAIPCNTFVLAAGPWSGDLAKRIMPARAKPVNITGERAHSIILKTPEELTPHAVFCRMFLNGRMFDPELYSRRGRFVYVCGATDPEPLPPSAAEVTTSSQQIRALLDCAAAVSTQLSRGELVRSQACYLPMSEKGLPMIGQLCDQIWINAGHTCWGLTLGPGSGQILAEMILEGEAKSCNVRELIP